MKGNLALPVLEPYVTPQWRNLNNISVITMVASPLKPNNSTNDDVVPS
jgi:hypothetical protein